MDLSNRIQDFASGVIFWWSFLVCVCSSIAGQTLINQCTNARHNSIQPLTTPSGGTGAAPHVHTQAHFVPPPFVFGPFPGGPMPASAPAPAQATPPASSSAFTPYSAAAASRSSTATATPATQSSRAGPSSVRSSQTASTRSTTATSATASSSTSQPASATSTRPTGRRHEPRNPHIPANSHRFAFEFDENGDYVSTNVLPPNAEELRDVMETMYPDGLPEGEDHVSLWQRHMAELALGTSPSSSTPSSASSSRSRSSSSEGGRRLLPGELLAGIYAQMANTRPGKLGLVCFHW